MILQFYRMAPDVPVPVWGTNGSTCFDLTFAPVSDVVSGFDGQSSVSYPRILAS